MKVEPYLLDERGAVEAALERALASWQGELGPEVEAAVAHGVLSGGKRVRPILCVSAYRACVSTDGGAALYDVAVALELIHAYSLMHDDLPCMDDAPLRRGVPTTHRVHGVETTTGAGAALIPLAARRALEGAAALGLDPATGTAVAQLVLAAAGAGGMVGGQALDLLGEGRRLSAAELDQLHRLKTGALLAAAPRLGGLLAGADPDIQAALGEYGRALGLTFQIADDVLDATASVEELGKQPSDAALDKSTYVSLFGLDEARRRGAREVDRACSALRAVGLEAPTLVALAHYVFERTR